MWSAPVARPELLQEERRGETALQDASHPASSRQKLARLRVWSLDVWNRVMQITDYAIQIARFETFLKSVKKSKTLRAIWTVVGLVIRIVRFEIAANRWCLAIPDIQGLKCSQIRSEPLGAIGATTSCDALQYPPNIPAPSLPKPLDCDNGNLLHCQGPEPWKIQSSSKVWVTGEGGSPPKGTF